MIYDTYVTRKWSLDGKKSVCAAYRAQSNIAAANIAAYRIIHAVALAKNGERERGRVFGA